MQSLDDLVHDLRNLLHTTRLAFGLFDTLEDAEPIYEARALIEAQTQQLVWSAENLQEAQRLWQDHLSLATESVDLSEKLRTVLQQLEPLAAKSQVTLVHQISDRPYLTTADAARLMKVLRNVIWHAIDEASTGGQVQVEAEFKDEAAIIAVTTTQTDRSHAGATQNEALFDWPRLDNESLRHVLQLFPLPVAARLLARQGGHLRAQDQPNGHQLVIELPRTVIA